MDIISIFFIAIGLSMDAFAVSVSNGILLKQVKIRDAFRTGIFFGIFQALMPIIGWFAGITFSNYIVNIDHWIAFILLALIGGNMIYESLKGNDDNKENKDPNSIKTLFVMAIATSIDALAVGVSFAMVAKTGDTIWLPALMIGSITFAISVIGVFVGKKAGDLFQKKAEIFGGFILIFIGIKILIEHLS